MGRGFGSRVRSLGGRVVGFGSRVTRDPRVTRVGCGVRVSDVGFLTAAAASWAALATSLALSAIHWFGAQGSGFGV